MGRDLFSYPLAAKFAQETLVGNFMKSLSKYMMSTTSLLAQAPWTSENPIQKVGEAGFPFAEAALDLPCNSHFDHSFHRGTQNRSESNWSIVFTLDPFLKIISHWLLSSPLIGSLTLVTSWILLLGDQQLQILVLETLTDKLPSMASCPSCCWALRYWPCLGKEES